MSEKNKYINQITLDFINLVSEDQAGYTLKSESYFPEYEEIVSPDQLRDPRKIADDFHKIDWAFTKDETGFLTHDLHPYPAKFIPQIPGHLISRLSLRGELVMDPFGGSGTTALETIRLGRRAFSIDANAVGTLIGKVKTCNITRSTATDLHALRSALTTRFFDLPSEEKLCKENETYIPEIPNVEKWFPLSSLGELSLIRSRIATMENEKARDIASLALSRIVLAVSFQDSETRYSSKPHDIPHGETLKRFLVALDDIVRNVVRTQPILRYGVGDFVTADSLQLNQGICRNDSVDLIVTSPPYGNANDYHLYHRFRLLWLGHDPRHLAQKKHGSHLRHQKESNGFEAYLAEMEQCLP